MQKSYRYLHLDVFTDRPFSGNQLAVYVDARHLSPAVMQAIAKEMNFAETVFVLPAERPGSDLRLRIFTPNEELPMAGHPTIGAAFALARTGMVVSSQERIVLDLGVGPTPVSLVWRDNQLAFAWMMQGLPTFRPPLADAAGAAASLGLPPGAVTGSGLPVQVVSCGVPFLFIPLATRQAVDSARLDERVYAEFCRTSGTDELPVFLFTTESGADIPDRADAAQRATAYSRMFAPALGITEDAATGGASGPLGCYLVQHNVVPAEKAGSMLSSQGVRMGRPSQIHIAIGLEAGHITSVRIGGEAIVAGEGILYI